MSPFRPLITGAAIAALTVAPMLLPAQAAPDAPPTLLQCPISQTGSRNGARPDPALLRQLVRCAKGETRVAPGEEGAVHVDVTALQVGTPRRWSYRQDTGNGTVSTIVYPVKVTYTVRTFYRAATEETSGWVRVLNCYVNAFGEWQIGSEESVRAGVFRRVPRG